MEIGWENSGWRLSRAVTRGSGVKGSAHLAAHEDLWRDSRPSGPFRRNPAAQASNNTMVAGEQPWAAGLSADRGHVSLRRGRRAALGEREAKGLLGRGRRRFHGGARAAGQQQEDEQGTMMTTHLEESNERRVPAQSEDVGG